MQSFHRIALVTAAFLAFCCPAAEIRVGMIGLDTGHALEFTKLLNKPEAPDHVPGARVVGALKRGSPDIENSLANADQYSEILQKSYGVTLYDSEAELLKHVDAMLVESVDGRVHLAQARTIIRAGKPLYIEKPLGASLREGIELFALARQHGVPVFSASALRFGRQTLAVRHGQIGRVVRAETTSAAHLEPHHTELFWYGIHGVESLFTVMGTGIESVTRKDSAPGAIEVTGRWSNGRSGTFRQVAKGSGGRAVGETGEAEIGQFDGYAPLVAAIVQFFRSGVSPVPERETLEILAFMEADALSKARGGVAVAISEVMPGAGAIVR